MKKYLLIIVLLMSCAHNPNNTSSNEEEYPEISVVLPKSENSLYLKNKKLVKLGIHQELNISFLFNNGHYWIYLDSKDQELLNFSINNSELYLDIEDSSDVGPESLIMSKQDNYFYSHGTARKSVTKFKLLIKRPNFDPIVVKYEVDFR